MTAPTLLFQGDSITDAGRIRNEPAASRINDPHALGTGYVGKIAGKLTSSTETSATKVFNRGISGNRITGLLDRWHRDCIHLAPDYLSILIGVNDLWHQEKSDTGVDPERFHLLFRHLLQHTQDRLPETKLAICQPFMFDGPEIGDHWPGLLAERATICHDLAKEFNAVWVPFADALNQATNDIPSSILVPDGVHPAPGGAEIMADCWLAAVGDAGWLS